MKSYKSIACTDFVNVNIAFIVHRGVKTPPFLKIQDPPPFNPTFKVKLAESNLAHQAQA